MKKIMALVGSLLMFAMTLVSTERAVSADKMAAEVKSLDEGSGANCGGDGSR